MSSRISDMSLQALENMLVTNPGVNLFTSYFFTDIPANSAPPADIYPATSQAYGNPSRNQVRNAFQAKCDQMKYDASGNQFVIDPNPSGLTASGDSGGFVSSYFPNQGTGLPNQAPTSSIGNAAPGYSNGAVSGPTIAAEPLIPLGVLPIPSLYTANPTNIVTPTDVLNSK